MSKVEQPVPVIVFDRDGEPYAFRPVHEARGEPEAIDAADEEYGVFTLDARYVRDRERSGGVRSTWS